MVELQLPKLIARVRFPSLAPYSQWFNCNTALLSIFPTTYNESQTGAGTASSQALQELGVAIQRTFSSHGIQSPARGALLVKPPRYAAPHIGDAQRSEARGRQAPPPGRKPTRWSRCRSCHTPPHHAEHPLRLQPVRQKQDADDCPCASRPCEHRMGGPNLATDRESFNIAASTASYASWSAGLRIRLSTSVSSRMLTRRKPF
jgi:hypothetical protein